MKKTGGSQDPNAALQALDAAYLTEATADAARRAYEKMKAQIILVAEKRLSNGSINMDAGKRSGKKQPLSAKNFDEFVALLSDRRFFTEKRVCSWCEENSYLQYFLRFFREEDTAVRLAVKKLRYKTLAGRTRNFLEHNRIRLEQDLKKALESYFNTELIYQLLKYNRRLDLFTVISGREEGSVKLRKHLLEHIPDSYVDLYPDARRIKRQFIIHHGPTNSGKTYESVNRLMQAQNGIYAGPLRLLAYEIYDRLNKAGVYCSLRTGEEFIDVPASTVMASTVEMVNLSEDYDIVVIDEAQLVADPFRGGSWTRVILGVKAREIHICCADEAVPILCRMIEDCNDRYELVSHSRNTPLLVDEREFVFPDSIEPHDALIVFSRRDVHAVAAELTERGHSCSIIYGNLPYDVRHREAEKFTRGETEVLVATDAIGLGLNLPIKRVVFLRMQKFDGHSVRTLTPPEIKQIGGRAGRFGMFDKGFVTSAEEKELIKKALDAKLPDLEYATIQFPETIIDIDAPMIDILQRWKDVTVNSGYRKADIEREIALCGMLKDLASDKYFLYKAITIPFDERDKELLELWVDMVWAEYDNDSLIGDVLHSGAVTDNRRLDYLERAYHICDMLYNFAVKFNHEEYGDEIMAAKQKISAAIIRKLSFISTKKNKPKSAKNGD
ncbi:MAG: helicase [Lachnospiraceae bacterium]|nr:helicase [Lachnospiraceae bacterium]